jgi:PHD/YefM family antitoxin component YafN of YafNO toxin-antitoxin module
MKTIQWTDPSSAESALQEARDEEVLVVRDGQPIAVVVPLSDDDAEWLRQELDPAFIRSIAEGRADAAAGRVISHDQLKKDLGL